MSALEELPPELWEHHVLPHVCGTGTALGDVLDWTALRRVSRRLYARTPAAPNPSALDLLPHAIWMDHIMPAVCADTGPRILRKVQAVSKDMRKKLDEFFGVKIFSIHKSVEINYSSFYCDTFLRRRPFRRPARLSRSSARRRRRRRAA